MKEWIVSAMQYTLSNWQSLLVEGVIAVGVVIFLMGVLKKLFLDKIPNKLVRKIVVSFLSLIIVLPATVIVIIYNRLDMTYFWVFYAINAAATILLYWFYENTGLRNLLSLIGKNTVYKLLGCLFNKEKNISDDLEKTMEEINKDTVSMLKEESKYKEDDLKNL